MSKKIRIFVIIKRSNKMKTLVIHPDDTTTTFLRPIYEGKGFNVRSDLCIDTKTMIELINSHDRIIMMGHGCPTGLFSLSYMCDRSNLIDSRYVDLLRTKECVFIWCNADQFVEKHHLHGFYTGMMCSEVGEAAWYNMKVSQFTVDKSNRLFSKIVGKHLFKSDAKELVKEEYWLDDNIITQFNNDRIYQR